MAGVVTLSSEESCSNDGSIEKLRVDYQEDNYCLENANTSISLDSVACASGSSNIRRNKKTSVGNTKTKPKKKKGTTLAHDAKKQKLAEDRAAKRSANELNKVFQPRECMKYMIIEVHPSLRSAWYMEDLSREVANVGAKIVSTPDIVDPALLLWSRKLVPTLDNQNGQVSLKSSERCEGALYVVRATELAALAAARRLGGRVRGAGQLAACALTLVVFGVKDYFKKSGRKTANSSRKLMDEIELELALTDLLVTTDCDSVVVNTPNELALLVVQYTRAIAEAPYKKQKYMCDEQADFYMRGASKNCIGLDNDGNGIERLWQQMMAILPMSSLEKARALCSQYKKPIELFEALQRPDIVNELANIEVARSTVPGSLSRRIGPEFARKLTTLFTSDDGSVILD